VPAAVRYWYLPQSRPRGPLSAGFPSGVAAACGAAADMKRVPAAGGPWCFGAAVVGCAGGGVSHAISTVEFSSPSPGGSTCPCPQSARGTKQG